MANQVVGINVFYTTPGEEPYKKNCLVCGSLFKKLEQVNVQTSFATALAGVSSKQDYYYCEHSNEEWHFKALKLYCAIQEMPSVSVAKIMQKDLDDMIFLAKQTMNKFDEINYTKITANLAAKLAKGDTNDKYEVFISLVDVINAVEVKALSKFKLNDLDVMSRSYTGVVDRQGIFELSQMDIVRLISLSEKVNTK